MRASCRNGSSLTRDEITATYAIIRHNVRTYRSAGVVEVVRGKQAADLTLKKFAECQASADYHEGWRYFSEKTDMRAGTDPIKATDLRQADLDLREANAVEQSDPIRRSLS